MTHVATALLLLAASPLASSGQVAVPATLEQKLREQRPDVLHWEIKPVESGGPAPAASIADLGRIGPRTAVRFTDGRVRWYAVVGMRRVLTSAHVVDVGAPLAGTDLAAAERDVIGLGCEPLAELPEAQRMRATRRLSSGDALCTQSIEKIPDVERGRSVVLSTQRGVITASRVLVAGSDAHAGERVRLRDPVTGDTVLAVATGAGAARVNSQEGK